MDGSEQSTPSPGAESQSHVVVPSLDALPNELLLQILQLLPLDASRRFRSTCRRFRDLVPFPITAFHVSTLELRDKDDLGVIDLLLKFNLTANIRTVKINVALFHDADFHGLQSFAEHLPKIEMSRTDNHA